MNTTYQVFTLATALVGSACAVTQYEKAVTVTKDASGNIVQRVETEHVIQPHQHGWPPEFEHLKGIIQGEEN